MHRVLLFCLLGCSFWEMLLEVGNTATSSLLLHKTVQYCRFRSLENGFSSSFLPSFLPSHYAHPAAHVEGSTRGKLSSVLVWFPLGSSCWDFDTPMNDFLMSREDQILSLWLHVIFRPPQYAAAAGKDVDSKICLHIVVPSQVLIPVSKAWLARTSMLISSHR
jgi:hypothetical protein